MKISLIDKEKEKQREENDLELVARPPSSHSFPTRQTVSMFRFSTYALVSNKRGDLNE